MFLSNCLERQRLCLVLFAPSDEAREKHDALLPFLDEKTNNCVEAFPSKHALQDRLDFYSGKK